MECRGRVRGRGAGEPRGSVRDMVERLTPTKEERDQVKLYYHSKKRVGGQEGDMRCKIGTHDEDLCNKLELEAVGS